MIHDGIPITTLERTVSTDVVNAQELAARTAAEMLSALRARSARGSVPASTPTVGLRTSIASGLMARVSGVDLVVSVGLLAQLVPASPPDVPAPGALDSDYRVGLQMVEETLADPWDGTNRWWLLEARVVRETTLEENRDIYNPATLSYSLSGTTLPKRYESRIEYQWTAGTLAAVPATSANWAPIAALFRPAGGGPLSESYLFPLTLQLEDIVTPGTAAGRCRRSRYFMRPINGLGRDSSDFEIDLETEVAGVRCHARTLTGQTFQPRGLVVEAASIAALNVADTWGYVYLAPGPDMMPRKNHYGETGLEVQGFLVVSRTPPDEHGANSLAVTTPAPLQYVIGAGEAACVGLVRSAGGATACRFVACSSEGEGRITAREFVGGFAMLAANTFGSAGSPHNLAVIGPGGTEDVPYGVILRCFVEHTTLDATAVAAALETTFGMGSALGLADDVATPGSWPRIMLSTNILQSKEFELHPNGNLSLLVSYVPRTSAMANSGGGAADGGTTVLRAGMHGFRF